MTRNLGPQPFDCRPGLRPSGASAEPLGGLQPCPRLHLNRRPRATAPLRPRTADLQPGREHRVKLASLWQGAWRQWEMHTDPQDSEADTGVGGKAQAARRAWR